MSEPVMKRLKISREGIVLIKSFEGFRPRAVQREEGGWVIGYGHTLSAREGASVSEADAELLLQYDLLPVANAVNDGVEGRVNQHQFDALASFVFSVGVDRFQSSDVLERIRAGFSAEAADAMVGWPEPALPEAALRRRAAERALFVADPASPVALADLLSAPLPPPPVPAPPVTVTEAAPEPEPDAAEQPIPTAVAARDARAAAVAHLLDTPANDGPEAEAPAPDAPVEDAPPISDAATEPPAEASTPELPEPVAESGDQPASAVAETNIDVVSNGAIEDPAPVDVPLSAEESDADADTAPDQSPVGDVTSDQPVEAAGVIEIEPETATDSTAGIDAGSPANPLPESEPAEAIEPHLDAPATEAGATTQASPLTFTSGVQRYIPYTASIVGSLPTPSLAPQPDAPTHLIDFAEPELAPAVTPETELPGSAEPLVLTPLAEGAFASTPRLVWPEDRRDGDDTDQSPLFDEDAILHRTLGPVVRPEFIDEAPGRFSWGEASAYLLMGGFGLVSVGMAMAAFRLASTQTSGADDTTMIGWVLAVIGAACVGVSAYNLYRRWGRSDD